MKKPVFRTKYSFTHHFLGFLEDYDCRGAFALNLDFDSIEAYCSRFYDCVVDGSLNFEDAVNSAFIWNTCDFRYWMRVSKKWEKFIHSK